MRHFHRLFFWTSSKKTQAKKTQAPENLKQKCQKNSRKSLKTEFFANSEAPIVLKLFKIQKIWHLLSQKPTIWAVFSQTLGKILKNPNTTQRINEKLKVFTKKLKEISLKLNFLPTLSW